MIIGAIVEAIQDALDELGYDAHDAPPGQFTPPSAVVELPETINYHVTAGKREHITVSVTVVVARTDAEDATQRLYAALSTEITPGVDTQPIQPALEAYDGPWRSLTVTGANSIGSVPLSSTSQQSGLAAQFRLEIATLPTNYEETS